MKRSTPLKRTGFARGRPVHVARDDGLLDVVGAAMAVVCAMPLRRGTYAAPFRALVAVPKRDYVRSPQLLANVGKLMYCELGRHHAVVCACHSNWEIHGKGGHIKADDNRIASGCLNCHHELDQGKEFTEPEKKMWWWHAHVATVSRMLACGLWPTGVPVPDTAHNPFTTGDEP